MEQVPGSIPTTGKETAMPNRAQRRSSEQTEFEKMGFRVTLETPRGTEPYEIQLANLSAADELDFHQVTGLTFFEAFASMSSYVIAAFVWLERRKYEKKLMFQEVAKEVKFQALETIEFMGDDEDDETEAPEPTYNGKNPELSGGPSVETSQGSPASTV
jgi:hypothetical protein